MKNLRKKLENWVLRKLLNSVTEEELFLNLSEEKSRDFALQAQDYIQKTSLFNQLLTEADRVASIKMFRKSKSIDDIRFAKAMLYSTDVLRKKAKYLAKNLPVQSQRIGRE